MQELDIWTFKCASVFLFPQKRPDFYEPMATKYCTAYLWYSAISRLTKVSIACMKTQIIIRIAEIHVQVYIMTTSNIALHCISTCDLYLAIVLSTTDEISSLLAKVPIFLLV